MNVPTEQHIESGPEISAESYDTSSDTDVSASSTTSINAACIKLLSTDATIPCRATLASAGYDLASSTNAIVPARGWVVVPTNLAIIPPSGCYARIAPRSGLAVRHGIQVGAGVIDADYTGDVGIVLFNMSDVDFTIAKFDRIAQLIFERHASPSLDIVDVIAPTTRGSGGYGHTGL